MRNILLIFFIAISICCKAQHTITICQQCLQKEIGFDIVSILDTQIIDSHCVKYTVKSPLKPKRQALFTDTADFDIYTFWLEPTIKDVKIYINRCLQRDVWMEKQSVLNNEERICWYYARYLEAKFNENVSPAFKKAYSEFLKNFILEHPNSYVSLFNYDILKDINKGDQFDYLFDTLSEEIKKSRTGHK